jgi:hypothetical protein
VTGVQTCALPIFVSADVTLEEEKIVLLGKTSFFLI